MHPTPHPQPPEPRRALPPGSADTRPVGRVVQLIEAAARAGRECPTNDQLAHGLGYKSPSTATALVRKAELQGLIRVERGQCARVVTAADGSWRTAGTIGAPHWRDRAAGA